MKTKKHQIGSPVEKIVFLISGLAIVSIIVMDKHYWGRSILEEGWPSFSVSYIIRSIIIFISTLAPLWILISSRKPTFELSESKGISLERATVLLGLLLSAIVLFLFLIKPSTFSELSKEDSLIEWGSAILSLGSCLIVTFSLLKNFRSKNISTITSLSLGLLALTFFVLCMEEVSWLQRVIDIETPEIFKDNIQHEMNLHNFSTHPVENLYYFGTFVFLVVFPFIRFVFPSISQNNYLKIFIARPFIGVIGAIACAYNFDMWNIIFTQITFFGSIMILCAFAIFSVVINDRYIILSAIVLIVVTQILFLIHGSNFERIFEITEYKEFFIPLALFIYSWDVFIHIKRTLLVGKRT